MTIRQPACYGFTMQRRDFLKVGSLSFLNLCLLHKIQAATKDPATKDYYLIFQGPDLDQPTPSSAFSFIIDQNFNLLKVLRTDFLVHSCVQDLDDPYRIYALSKDPMSCVIDLKKMEMSRTFAAEPGFRFYGHGQITPDGKFLMTVENPLNHSPGQTGQIVFRDRQTLKVQHKFSSHGKTPHQIKIRGNSLIIANAGGFRPDGFKSGKLKDDNLSCVAEVRMRDGALLNKHVMDPYLAATHLEYDEQGWIGVGGFDHRAGYYKGQSVALVISPEGKIRHLKPPAELEFAFIGESAQLAMDEANSHLFSASRGKKKILVWNYRTGQLLEVVDLYRAASFVWSSDKQKLEICSTEGENYKMRILKPSNLEVQAYKGPQLPLTMFIGPHMLRARVPS